MVLEQHSSFVADLTGFLNLSGLCIHHSCSQLNPARVFRKVVATLNILQAVPYGGLVPEISANCPSILLLDFLIMQEGTSCQSGITLNLKVHVCARLNTRAGAFMKLTLYPKKIKKWQRNCSLPLKNKICLHFHADRQSQSPVNSLIKSPSLVGFLSKRNANFLDGTATTCSGYVQK